MTMHTQLLLGSLGLLALLGCSSSDSSHSSGYLVNAIAVADIDANGLPDGGPARQHPGACLAPGLRLVGWRRCKPAQAIQDRWRCRKAP